MMRRHIAATLAAAGLLCSACSSVEDDGRTAFGPKPLFDPVVLPSSSTGSAVVPLPFDALFGTDADLSDESPTAADADNNLDGTLDLFPLLGAASLVGPGLVDGWSTTANLFFDLVGPVDVAAAANGVRVFNATSPRELQPGVDFLIEVSPVVQGRTRLIVHWLQPLNESSRYLVGITRDLRAPDGSPALENEVFALLRSDTPVAENTSNTIVQSLVALGQPQKIPQLQQLQQQLIRPVVAGLGQLSTQLPNSRGAIGTNDLVLAWSFTTQSITPTLERLAGRVTPQSIVAFDSGLNLSQALSPDPSMPVPVTRDADVYVGVLDLPYHLADAAENPAAILQTFFRNDGTQATGAIHPGLGAPCAALQRPTSTTICYPDPTVRSTQSVPVLLTRPAGTMPAGGWPVVIFVHGITGDRSNMLGVAPALTAAGFVVIAIDQPLHGVAPSSPLRVPGTTERTFDVDLVDNVTGAPGPDGLPDASGTHFINLSSLVTSRDNLRQAAVDQLVLRASLENLRLGPMQQETLNTGVVRLVGHSLGGIVGTTTLALTDEIGAATLAMPGGGIAKLLDASQTFGPQIAAGLAVNNVIEGTDNYENFLRIAQLVSDPGDPINWAARAVARHPLHLIEVVGDTVVPNNALTDATFCAPPNPAPLCVDGYLSGTDPLARVMELQTTAVNPPVAASAATIISGSQRVRFATGTHSSIVLPATPNPADDPVYLEMQNQMVQFLASNGACLPIGTDCPQPQGAKE